MSDSVRFVFEENAAKAPRAQGAATGDVAGLADNFLLENFKPNAVVQLVTSTDNYSNRIVQLFRRDCTIVRSCPANVFLDQFLFSKDKNCVSAVNCKGLCVKDLTDGDATASTAFDLPAVRLVGVLGFTQDYTSATPAYGSAVGAPPSQSAYLYIQSQKVVTVTAGSNTTTSLRKIATIPQSLKICFPECNACPSGFEKLRDDETAVAVVNGRPAGGYYGYTHAAINAVLPVNAAGAFHFLHVINASAAEKIANYNSDANQIPHTQLRWEFQQYSNLANESAWRTIAVQYESSTVEGCVYIPCLTNYLTGYGYGVGDVIVAGSEYRLAVTRYATAKDQINVSGSVVGWKNIDGAAFALAEIELIAEESTTNTFDDTTIAQDLCADASYVWTAIPPHEAGVSWTAAANNAADDVGRLTLKQLDTEGQILELQNFSTSVHTYRVHLISPNTAFAATQ
jgi:hypothetical protein